MPDAEQSLQQGEWREMFNIYNIGTVKDPAHPLKLPVRAFGSAWTR